MMHIYIQCINVKNHLGLAAKVSQEINNNTNMVKFFFCLIWPAFQRIMYFLENELSGLCHHFLIDS